MRETKGITLISLIITIIVMLILIAVTVNILIESGIIGSAKNAANKTQTAYHNEATLGKVTIGGKEYNSIEEYRQQGNSEQPEPEAPCTHTWGEWLETTPATCTAEGVEKSTCTQCGKTETRAVAMAAHTYVDGICSVCGASEPITASTIANVTTKSEYYGDYVTGITFNNGDTETEWRIFYADTNNIYLIAADYIDAQKYISSTLVDNIDNYTGTKPHTKYCAYFKKTIALEAYNGGATEEAIFGEGKVGKTLLGTYLNYLTTNNLTKNNDNMKATAFLLDTTAWSGYTDSTQTTKYIDYAIGGPTVEIFKDSYNGYQGSTTMYTPVGEHGYYFGNSPTTTSFATSIEKSNDLYVNDTTSNKAAGYWFASPSAHFNGCCLCNVFYVGQVNNYDFDVYPVGFRPVICLNTNVKLTPSGTDTYTVEY